MRCLQCGSEKIAEGVHAIDHVDHGVRRSLSLLTNGNPRALIFKQPEFYPLSANVCADCGYVMFTVFKHDAAKLYENRKREREAM